MQNGQSLSHLIDEGTRQALPIEDVVVGLPGSTSMLPFNPAFNVFR